MSESLGSIPSFETMKQEDLVWFHQRNYFGWFDQANDWWRIIMYRGVVEIWPDYNDDERYDDFSLANWILI